MNSLFFLFLILSFGLSVLGFPCLLSLLAASSYLRENYEGRKVPAGGGILILLSFIGVLAIVVLASREILHFFQEWLPPLVILMLGVGFLGLLDDLLGTRAFGGFRGHFRELARGHLTSGAIKAIGGGLLSLYVAGFFSKSLPLLFLNALLLALCINTFNLLDLRPGRVLKTFLILGLVMFLSSSGHRFWDLWGILLGPVALLLWADLGEKVMLGDVGSNVLGAVIGFSFMINFSWMVNLVVVGVLVVVQLYAEKYSITELISRISVLRWLDEFGRKGKIV